jgi:hypothetical protein
MCFLVVRWAEKQPNAGRTGPSVRLSLFGCSVGEEWAGVGSNHRPTDYESDGLRAKPLQMHRFAGSWGSWWGSFQAALRARYVSSSPATSASEPGIRWP